MTLEKNLRTARRKHENNLRSIVTSWRSYERLRGSIVGDLGLTDVCERFHDMLRMRWL